MGPYAFMLPKITQQLIDSVSPVLMRLGERSPVPGVARRFSVGVKVALTSLHSAHMIQGCIIDKCISKLMAIMTTVTTTSYAALAATVTVNSLLSETITSYYAPTTETTWSSTIWPTTNQVTVPATRTTTVVQTTFVKRSEGDFDYTVPASAPTAPPAAPAVKRHGGKAHANYNKRAINAVKPAADGAQHQAKRRSDALSAMSPVKRSKLMKRSFCDDLGKFMDCE